MRINNLDGDEVKLRSYIVWHKFFFAVQREIFMPMSTCCIKGTFYVKSTLLYSKGSFYANVFGIKAPCVKMLDIKDES